MNQKSSAKQWSDGRAQLPALKSATFLHNWREDYEAIGDDFSPIEIGLMDSIIDKIISVQEARERIVYDKLQVADIKELNEQYSDNGGANQEFLSTTAEQVISMAADRAFSGDWMNRKDNDSNVRHYNAAFKEAMNQLVKNRNDRIAEVQHKLSEGLVPDITHWQELGKTKKTRNSTMEQYTNQLEKSIRNDVRKAVLEREVEIVMSQLVATAAKHNSNSSVKATAQDLGSTGKQVKADVTMIFDGDFMSGISAKNYKMRKNGMVEFTLHGDQSLDNFFRLLETMQANDFNIDIAAIRSLAEKFKQPDFKYHLVNQAAFLANKQVHQKQLRQKAAGRKLTGVAIENSAAATNIISFIKACLPLFIGSQLKINGNITNVDFMNINGTFIAVSTILKEVLHNKTGLITQSVNIYHNYDVPWNEMLISKRSVDSNGEFYTNRAIEIGSQQGQKVYQKMKIGHVHLSMVLASFK